MKNLEKKSWEKPEVTKLSIKDLTHTGTPKSKETGQGHGPSAS